jgi:hypothetical protein
VQVQIHLAAQVGHVAGDQLERAREGVDPLARGMTTEVERVAGLVGVRLGHRERVVVDEREHERVGDRHETCLVGCGLPLTSSE